jgi:predicted DNA-binding transcriptional regulator AlpA
MRDRPAPHSPELPCVLSAKQVRQALGVSPSTLHRMRREGGFPAPIQISPGRIGWERTIIAAWLAARRGDRHEGE